MSERVKPQLVWLPDGLGAGEHVHVYRAADYAALEAECERLRQQPARDSAELRRLCAERDHLKACQENAQLHMTGLVAERNAALRQRDKLAGLLRDISSSESRGLDWTKQIDAALAEIKP